MNTKPLITFHLAAMGALVALAVVFPEQVAAFLGSRPELYAHAKLAHVLSVTLFFANVVIGTLWETRSLLSGKPEHVRFTYRTVAWMDACFTAPLILVALVSGLALATMLGGLFSAGWLALSFVLFCASGVVWVAADIPTQYRVKRLFEALPEGAEALAPELDELLRFRLRLNLLSIAPLLVVFALMVEKPELRFMNPVLARPKAASAGP